MQKDEIKKVKEILEKFGCHYDDEQIIEIQKNISSLSELISGFEKRKRPKGTSPPQKLV
ncbi:MAG: hypothetical protein AAB352_03235 [Patescibacteria group bacterium]